MVKKTLLISTLLVGTLLYANDNESNYTPAEKFSAALTSLGKTREVFSLFKEVLAPEDSAAFDWVENRVLYLGEKKIPSYFCPTPVDRTFCAEVFKATSPTDLKNILQNWATEHKISFEETEELFITMKYYFLVAHITFITAPALKKNPLDLEKVLCVTKLLDRHISHLYKLEGV